MRMAVRQSHRRCIWGWTVSSGRRVSLRPGIAASDISVAPYLAGKDLVAAVQVPGERLEMDVEMANPGEVDAG
jgi:hypothetical protein